MSQCNGEFAGIQWLRPSTNELPVPRRRIGFNVENEKWLSLLQAELAHLPRAARLASGDYHDVVAKSCNGCVSLHCPWARPRRLRWEL